MPQAPIADLYDILPTDLSHPYNIEDVVARIVDASQCVPLCPEFGEEIYSCFATVDGLPVVIIANRAQTIESDGRLKSGGILYKEGIVKIRRIASAANDDGIPTIWIQDVAGFDIGAQAERDGLLRLGAGILHEIASDERDTPAAMTIVLRKASGAGYYAMKGSPFHPAWTVVTAITRMEVMRSDVLASALYDKKISKIDGEIKARQIKDGLALDCAEIAQLARNRDELVEARTALASAQNDNAQPRAALARRFIRGAFSIAPRNRRFPSCRLARATNREAKAFVGYLVVVRRWNVPPATMRLGGAGGIGGVICWQ